MDGVGRFGALVLASPAAAKPVDGSRLGRAAAGRRAGRSSHSVMRMRQDSVTAQHDHGGWSKGAVSLTVSRAG